jgi:hypothetical protein
MLTHGTCEFLVVCPQMYATEYVLVNSCCKVMRTACCHDFSSLVVLAERNKYYIVTSICFALLRSQLIYGYTPTHLNETFALPTVAHLPLLPSFTWPFSLREC